MIFEQLTKYRISPGNFFGGTTDFVWAWLSSRSLVNLLAGSIPVALSAGLLILFWRAESVTYRSELLSDYDALAQQALDAGQLDASALYFAKSIALATDSNARSFEVAKSWYDSGHHHRSLEILQTLAPMTTQGYVPAHEYLASHWKLQEEKTDVTRALTLFHEMHAARLEERPRIRLARFLSDHGHHEHALRYLTAKLNPSPQLRLQRVQVLSRSGKPLAAAQEAATAEASLQQQLTNAPDDNRVRIWLSRAIACQDRLLPAIFVLAEGCQDEAPPALVDELIKSYTIWLSGMSPESRQKQMDQIELAFESNSNQQATAELTLQNGTTVAMPRAIAQLHSHLLDGEGDWLIPLLEGTRLASSEDYAGAVEQLRLSHKLRQENSLVANNLAWAILHLNASSGEGAKDLAGPLDAELTNAWELANMAVSKHPNEPAFRETRGQIAGQLKRWEEATHDLNECIAMGHNSPAIQATLKRARVFELSLPTE